MKKALLLITIAFSLSVYAFKSFEASATSALQKLAIPEEIARDCIWSSFSGMYFSSPGGAKLKQTPANERGALTREIGEYAKAYTRTEGFKKHYVEYRDGRKPTPPEKPKPMAQQKKEYKEQIQKSIKETEESMKGMTTDQQEMMKGGVNTLREQLKSLDDPNNQMFNPEMEKILQQGYEAEVQEYKNKLATWEKENPQTPNAMIKRWLTGFLEVSKDVDFKAALVPIEGGRMRFANPEYERKDGNWKMCFRAGKETVDAGRTFAKQWLDELNKAR